MSEDWKKRKGELRWALKNNKERLAQEKKSLKIYTLQHKERISQIQDERKTIHQKLKAVDKRLKRK